MICVACAVALGTSAGVAEGVEPGAPSAAPAASASTAASAASAPSDGLGAPRKVPGEAIDYAIPALEIIGFDFLVNRLNYHFGSPKEDYAVTASTIRRNLHSGWDSDRDPFNINQLGHPYQGSMYHGFARSAGFNYWESAGYTFAGSAFWEVFGETTHPSINDQVATGIGGTFLGEALFRMSSLILERGGGMPRFWRELAAAAVSPSTGFNRLVFSDRYGAVFSSKDAAYYSRLGIGYSRGVREEVGVTSTRFQPNEAQLDFSIDYGLPGRKGYEYTRPFDYFTFQATASSANGFENVLTRGLLVGKPYDVGSDYHGVWGLYGSYDYISPQTFRVSATGLSLGSTGHLRLTDDLSLEGTGMAGVGYTAVGTSHASAPATASTDRNYNYGVTPQALLTLRLVHADRVSFDVTGREYFVSKVASGTSGGHDNIVRLDAALTWRLHEQHAVSIRYLGNRRDASFPGSSGGRQVRNTVGVFYTLLGRDRFGAEEPR
ncbi:MAG TPA: DUF3943 domain-containing protein [Caldimonas sp.]|nr:DUF3943 domain-containing protein [Caldimonas sp.]